MQKKKQNLVKRINNLLLAFCFAFLFIFPSFTSVIANAVTVTGYSSVLGDLLIDPNFDKENFPYNDEDKEMKVIQIAESTSGELFIYTYQPNVRVEQYNLTQASISQTMNDSLKYQLYNLQLLDSDGVFCKYKVLGIDLKQDVVRYYLISELFREFSDTFDEQPTNGTTISELPISVAQHWTACTLDGETYYNLEVENVVTITDKYVGFVEYEDGFSLKSLVVDEACQSHFVAFSTDYEIDDLYEADVYYVSQERQYYDYNDNVTFGSEKENYAYLTASEETEYLQNGWFTKQKYSWHRIQTIDEFLNSTADVEIYEHLVFNVVSKTKLQSSTANNIKNMQYVLRFTETSYKETEVKYSPSPFVTTTMTGHRINETAIQDVTILRLKFLSNGVVYNLGAIDNKMTGSGISDSYTEWYVELSETFKQFLNVFKYIFLALIIIVAVILLSIFTPFFKIVWNVIKKVSKVLWLIISSPFTWIKSLFDKGGKT